MVDRFVGGVVMSCDSKNLTTKNTKSKYRMDNGMLYDGNNEFFEVAVERKIVSHVTVILFGPMANSWLSFSSTPTQSFLSTA
jgi:hypothetical protein